MICWISVWFGSSSLPRYHCREWWGPNVVSAEPTTSERLPSPTTHCSPCASGSIRNRKASLPSHPTILSAHLLLPDCSNDWTFRQCNIFGMMMYAFFFVAIFVYLFPVQLVYIWFFVFYTFRFGFVYTYRINALTGVYCKWQKSRYFLSIAEGNGWMWLVVV